jgi:hypothetical protein
MDCFTWDPLFFGVDLGGPSCAVVFRSKAVMHIYCFSKQKLLLPDANIKLAGLEKQPRIDEKAGIRKSWHDGSFLKLVEI